MAGQPCAEQEVVGGREEGRLAAGRSGEEVAEHGRGLAG